MVAMIMGSEKGWKKGPWSLEEDKLLSEYVSLHGEGRWSSVAKFTGLNRSSKSCRLRWVNYLKPGLKKGQLTPQEEAIIFELHAVLGNKWSTIAKYLPGRTDNEIKNYWRTHFKKKEKPFEKNKRQDKRRAKMLLKQMKHQEQQPPQQYDRDENKISSISSHSESNIHEPNFSDTTAQHNIDQGMGISVMNQTIEDQYCNNNYLPFMYQDLYFPSLLPHDTAALEEEDEGLWVTLWNLEEPQGHADHVLNHCTKYAMHNQDKNINSGFDDMSNNLCYAKYMFG